MLPPLQCDAYARATGKVGVASVTCGPGYTQIMTALVMAARGNAPVYNDPALNPQLYGAKAPSEA